MLGRPSFSRSERATWRTGSPVIASSPRCADRQSLGRSSSFGTRAVVRGPIARRSTTPRASPWRRSPRSNSHSSRAARTNPSARGAHSWRPPSRFACGAESPPRPSWTSTESCLAGCGVERETSDAKWWQRGAFRSTSSPVVGAFSHSGSRARLPAAASRPRSATPVSASTSRKRPAARRRTSAARSGREKESAGEARAVRVAGMARRAALEPRA